jgi:hypothetical protein
MLTSSQQGCMLRGPGSLALAPDIGADMLVLISVVEGMTFESFDDHDGYVELLLTVDGMVVEPIYHGCIRTAQFTSLGAD